jgi:hypothetical protein
MSGVAQEPSAHLPLQPAGAPQIPGDRGSQAATEANRAAVRAAFGAWQAGTGAITSLFASDMQWRIEGRSAVSKGYRSRQQFIDEVLAPFGARFAAGERSVPCGSARSTRMATP